MLNMQLHTRSASILLVAHLTVCFLVRSDSSTGRHESNRTAPQMKHDKRRTTLSRNSHLANKPDVIDTRINKNSLQLKAQTPRDALICVCKCRHIDFLRTRSENETNCVFNVLIKDSL